MTMQWVRVKNKSDKDMTFMWNSEKTIIKRGSEGIITWECAAKDFGNPFAVDVPEKNIRDRAHEWERVRVLYGVYDDDHLMEENFPKVECYDPEGNRLYMLFEDFDGTKGGGVVNVDAGNDSNDLMARLLREIESLKGQVATLSGMSLDSATITGDDEGVAPISTTDVTEDSPAAVAPKAPTAEPKSTSSTRLRSNKVTADA